jgi:hypothetical protein
MFEPNDVGGRFRAGCYRDKAAGAKTVDPILPRFQRWSLGKFEPKPRIRRLPD